MEVAPGQAEEGKSTRITLSHAPEIGTDKRNGQHLFFPLPSSQVPLREKRKEKGNPGQKARKVIVVGGLGVGQLLPLQERRRWMMLADGW